MFDTKEPCLKATVTKAGLQGLPAWIANRADGAWIGSWIVVFNLPQSPANLYRTHFKIPGSRLSKVLELTIDSILENGKLASYKIARNGPRTKFVLWFDANMADTSVSPIHQSTPLGRKSTNQRRREREWWEEHENPSTKKIVQYKVWRKCMHRHDTKSSDLWRRQRPSLSKCVWHSYLHRSRDKTNRNTARETVPTIRYHQEQIEVTINTTETSNSLLIRQLGKEPRRKRRQEW